MTQLRQHFGDAFIDGRPLGPLTTLKVGGPAQGFLTVTNVEDLKRALQTVVNAHIPFLIIGKGANLIIPDEGFRGLVIQLKGDFETIRVTRKTHTFVYIRAGAGCTLSSLLSSAADAGLSGLEPFTGIPATIGGAVRMNAGIPGLSLSDILASITCLRPDGTVIRRHASRLHPTYRDMCLPEGWIILNATFRLTPAPEKEIQERMQDYREKRGTQAWQRHPTAGSIFKNPQGKFAGQLIEESGLKGYRVGDAQISPDHANIIINRGHATARDVLDLITFAQERVYEKTGVKLDLEVVIAKN